MAFSAKLTDGTTEIDFVYDPGVQDKYRMKYGATVQIEDTQVLQHKPDNDEPTPIRGHDLTRTAILRKDVYGDSRDDVLNQIAVVKRWVDGADQQALRYWTNGDVNRIDFKIQLDSTTNYTLNPVQWGYVDDSAAFYRPETSKPNAPNFAMQIAVILHLSAYGEGASFTLHNDLPSSPHCLEDSNSDGLADGWSQSGSPTTTLITARYLIGGQCQRMVTDTTNAQALITPTATATTSQALAAYVWIATSATSNDVLTIRLQDGSGNNVESKTFDPANPTAAAWDKSATGLDGTIWYRFSFTHTGSPARTAANAKILLSRTAGEATTASTYFFDGAYIKVGTTTVPDAWCSTSAIQNRYDPTSSNEGRINYLDVWGVPGDSDAAVNIAATVTAVGGFPFRSHWARIKDGKTLAADRKYWFDDLVAGGVINGSYSTVVDASRSGGGYLRYTSTASGSANFTVSLGTNSELLDFMRWPSRVYAITRTSNTASTIELSSAAGSTIISSGLGYTAVSTWEWIDLGLINPSSVYDIGDFFPAGGSNSILFRINATAGSVTIEIDAIICIPVVEDGFLIGESTSYSVNDVLNVIGEEKQYLAVSLGSEWVGEMWTAAPGIMNRYILNVSNVSNVHDLTNTYTVSATVIPRSRHLLGTL